MSDFERKFKNLPWRKPSSELKEKIFSENSVSTSTVSPALESGRQVTLQLSAALALAAGFVGFVMGAMLPTSQADTTVASIDNLRTDIRIVETSSQRNSFDFSTSATQILPGDFIAYIESEPESSR